MILRRSVKLLSLIRIKMNDGQTFSADIESYDAATLTEELNGNKTFINIGDLIVQRYSVVHVTPIKEDETEEEETL